MTLLNQSAKLAKCWFDGAPHGDRPELSFLELFRAHFCEKTYNANLISMQKFRTSKAPRPLNFMEVTAAILVMTRPFISGLH